MFPTIIKTPHVGNFAIQMDDDDCNSESRDHAPSVCLDDLFQLCNLDSCFRWGWAAPIGVMTPFEFSGPFVGPMCFKQKGCDDSSAADRHPSPLDSFSTRVNTACVLDPTADLSQTPPDAMNPNWKKLVQIIKGHSWKEPNKNTIK